LVVGPYGVNKEKSKSEKKVKIKWGNWKKKRKAGIFGDNVQRWGGQVFDQ
jgi:membrane glycosyltransferase